MAFGRMAPPDPDYIVSDNPRQGEKIVEDGDTNDETGIQTQATGMTVHMMQLANGYDQSRWRHR